MTNITFLFFFICTSFISTASFSQEYIPSHLVFTDNLFSHHVLLAEKGTHKLHLYENSEDGIPKKIKTIQMASGKKAGDKIFQGDHRTPEGIFFFTEFLTRKTLIDRHGKEGEIYGVGAFVMDYPNPIDLNNKKTGYGIWLHSTNDETRIDKGLDSRGCLVAGNSNLIELSRFIELNRTPVIVTHNIDYLTKDAWLKEQNKLKSTITQWATAWRKENFNKYISFYSNSFKDPKRGGIEKFRTYKKHIFNNPGKPDVQVKDLSIFRVKDYAVAQFKQIYKSKTITDTGRKILYLKQDQYYNWQIVSENWTKKGLVLKTNGDQPVTAFTPSMRFFENENAELILNNNKE